MKILVVGGTGFIGSFLVSQLSGHQVTLLHRGSNPLLAESDRVKHLIASRAELPGMRARLAAEKYDVVVDMISSNADDAAVIVKTFSGIVNKVVVVSSGSVYKTFGRFLGTEPGAVTNQRNAETAQLRSEWYPYASRFPRFEGDPLAHLKTYDKIPVEETYSAAADLDFCIVRLPYVYGPGDKDKRVAHYLKRMAESSQIFMDELVGNWRNSRSYVENVALALQLVVEKGKPGGIYNISTLEDLTEKEWVEQIASVIGWDGEIKYTSDKEKAMLPLIEEFPKSADYRQHLQLDSKKIREELQFSEKIDFRTGLQRTIKEAKSALC